MARRYIQTDDDETPIMDFLRQPHERAIWKHIRRSKSSTISGFYPLSLSLTSFETAYPIEVITETLMTLAEHGDIVWDGSFIFIPIQAKECAPNNYPSAKWDGLTRHINSVYENYRGEEKNVAWQAFKKHFEHEITSNGEKSSVLRVNGKFVARGTAPTSSTGAVISPPPSRYTAPPAPARNQGPADYDEDSVIAFFTRYQQRGTGTKCPEPIEHEAAKCFAKMERMGVPNDKHEAYCIEWIHRCIKDEQERAEGYESGFAKTESGHKGVKLW